MSPKTKACNLPSVKSKPNKKVTNNKKHLFGRSPSIVETIKEYTQNRNGDIENRNDTRYYKTNTREWTSRYETTFGKTIVNGHSLC